MAFNIVTIKAAHIREIVDVHMRAFPGFFLTFLGPKFLSEFYSSFTRDPMGVGLVAEDAATGKVLGIIVGPLSPEGYFKRLLKQRWWAFCVASIKAVLKRPSSAKRLFRALLYRGQAPIGRPRSLLSSIAVAPKAQGQGIGKALVGAWIEEIHRRGSNGCYLTTDADGNNKVNSFYQKLGWKLETTYKTPEGRTMSLYILDLPEKNQKE